MNELLIAAAGSDAGSLNPIYFVLGGLALLVVSTLGPLSRMHERRSELKEQAAQRAAAAKSTDQN